MVYDFRIHDFYMMFKPFKYWGDYSVDEHTEWYSGLPDNPFEEMVTSTKKRTKYVNQLITPELQNMLELMYFNAPQSSVGSPSPTPMSPLAKMMSPKLRESVIFRQRRRRSSSS